LVAAEEERMGLGAGEIMGMVVEGEGEEEGSVVAEGDSRIDVVAVVVVGFRQANGDAVKRLRSARTGFQEEGMEERDEVEDADGFDLPSKYPHHFIEPLSAITSRSRQYAHHAAEPFVSVTAGRLPHISRPKHPCGLLQGTNEINSTKCCPLTPVSLFQ
jgi:hypothetical protein